MVLMPARRLKSSTDCWVLPDMNLSSRLEAGEFLLSDGAMGTMLFRHGLKQGDCPESWNLEHPDILTRIAGEYRDAGSDILQTNTFGASPMKLTDYGLEKQTEEINKAAVRAVKQAAGDRCFVAGSCGPTGRILRPYGDTDPKEVQEAFERQIRALVEAEVDILFIETMIDLQEAMLALRAARTVAEELPVAVTMTFEKTGKGFFTVMGNSIEASVSSLRREGANIVGSNCGNGIDVMVEISAGLHRCTDYPLLIQSNAGIPRVTDGELVYPESPEYFASRVPDLVEAGATIIGGCCGTSYEHIRALRESLDRYLNREAVLSGRFRNDYEEHN